MTFEEHRHFTRIPFDAEAVLIDPADGRRFDARLVDICLKGALTTRPEGWLTEAGHPWLLELHLAGDEVVLNMEVTVAHIEADQVGFRCEQMDLDTATHLHRLVELNLGDPKILERELAELIQAGE